MLTDVKKFTEILNDKIFGDYKKAAYKYGDDFKEFLTDLADIYYKELPLFDKNGAPLVFIDGYAKLVQSSSKILLKEQSETYAVKCVEDEIISTCAIESIDFSRDSVLNILKGLAPKNNEETRIAGLKKGFEFISGRNSITEENIYKLYMMTVGDFLPPEERLPQGSLYRNDNVYVVSDRIDHTGFKAENVPDAMKALIEYINTDDDTNDFYKAAIIHFYFCYIHPYFDGNGRMARLLHLWFLITHGYKSALFVPFSSLIEKSRSKYYTAYSRVEENRAYCKVTDVTPFILYFAENVYNKLSAQTNGDSVFKIYDEALAQGKITAKENALWKFVLSFYGGEEFSTKQLEKDFSDAAYATIRGFVLKFTDLRLLTAAKYGTRTKYKIKQ